jgi:hypothetical protein
MPRQPECQDDHRGDHRRGDQHPRVAERDSSEGEEREGKQPGDRERRDPPGDVLALEEAPGPHVQADRPRPATIGLMTAGDGFAMVHS